MPLDGARFESRVDRSGLHHIWLGARSPGGGGQVRVDGKLLTAARAAWEIENGSVPDGVRVLSCAGEPACVRVDHLRLDQRAISSASPPSKKRSPRGAGTITAISPGVWKIGVTAGVDRLGQRHRTFRTIYGTRNDAATALAALVTEIGDGHRLLRQDDKQLTVDSLVDWYLEFAREDRGLEHSTLTSYADAYSHWLKEPIGHKRASSITTAELDKAFDRMRRAGLSRSRMTNARALLSGAYKWGKRHRKVTRNPVDGFELPTATHAPRHTTAPELDDMLRLLATADEHDELLAPVLRLDSDHRSATRRALGSATRPAAPRPARAHRRHSDQRCRRNCRRKANENEEQPSRQPRRSNRRTAPPAPCPYGCSGSRLRDPRGPGWFRVQPRPHVQHSPAPGIDHPTYAPTASRVPRDRRQLRCHNPRPCAGRQRAN